MYALAIASLTFVCLFGGSLLGIRLRNALPEHHLSDDSRHLLGMGLGIIGTMAGLVLGLLVSAATGSYNAQRSELVDVASKVVLLDRILAHYGPEADASRRELAVAVRQTIDRMWPQGGSRGSRLDPSVRGEAVLDSIEELSPANDGQRSLKADAVGLAVNLAQIRWLMFEQSGTAISAPLLAVLIFWFSITFIGFGLFSPQNATVIVALGLCSLAVSGAIYVTLAMYTPFEGMGQISSAPLREALQHLGANP